VLQTANRKTVGFLRIFARVLGIGLGFMILWSATCLAWIFYYSADLPDLNGLARYAPGQVSRESDSCIVGDSTAVPYEVIGDTLRVALNPAEGNEHTGNAGLSMQISRTMFCVPLRTLDRELKEWRVAAQLQRRFSKTELLTIYANRTYFGENLIGVEAASQHYFHKEPNQLGIAEAALLAGLVRGPSYFSPLKHPDRAVKRRNEVIDGMIQSRAISIEQGEAAKATSLAVTTR
jgi:penicillin-binding protein 1A